jgi:CRP/FNR family transcriptional regulator, cyclic AMP receptor protein
VKSASKPRAALTLESFGILAMHWAEQLSPELRRRLIDESTVRKVSAGTLVCRMGEPANAWIGVLSGLVKIAAPMRTGRSVSFTGIPAGGWFGEGSVLKEEPRRYEAVALRDSVVAYVPRATFMLLLESSVTFNRFILTQLNERLAQFIGMVERDRALAPEARLATELAALFNPKLYPGNRTQLPVSQQELAQLVGLSRQRVNRALKQLASAGLIRVDYRGVEVLDLQALMTYSDEPAAARPDGGS